MVLRNSLKEVAGGFLFVPEHRRGKRGFFACGEALLDDGLMPLAE